MRRIDLIKNVLKNTLSHLIDFLRVEAETKVFINALRGVYKVPHLRKKKV